MSKLLDQWRGRAVVMKNSSGRIGAYCVCGRCNGTGLVMRFSHVHKGVCFKCHGQGWALLPIAAERVVLRAVGLKQVMEAA